MPKPVQRIRIRECSLRPLWSVYFFALALPAAISLQMASRVDHPPVDHFLLPLPLLSLR